MRNKSKAGLLTAAVMASVASMTMATSMAGAQTDLDCGDPGTFHNMPVPPEDPHDLDDDGDGIGCENADAFDGGGGGSSTTAPPAPTMPTVPTTAPSPSPTPAPPPPAEPVVAEPNFTG